MMNCEEYVVKVLTETQERCERLEVFINELEESLEEKNKELSLYETIFKEFAHHCYYGSNTESVDLELKEYYPNEKVLFDFLTKKFPDMQVHDYRKGEEE